MSRKNENQKRQLQVKACTHLWKNVQENKYGEWTKTFKGKIIKHVDLYIIFKYDKS